MFLAPKKLIVEVSTKIESPSNVSFNLVNDLEKWSLWSPVHSLDPESIHEYTDNSEGVGAKWSWKGNENIGVGSQTIINSHSPDSIKMSLEFKGTKGEAFTFWTFEENKNKTKVSWKIEGPPTPFHLRPFNIFKKKALKKSFKSGLNELKRISEERSKENKYRGYLIKEVDLDERNYIMKRQEVDFANMQQFYTQNLGGLFSKVLASGEEMQGMPSGLFFKYDEQAKIADMAAAIPIKQAKEFSDAASYTIPSGKAIQVDYYGDYSGLSEAHIAIDEYIKDKALFYNYPVVEEYITDPGENEDPSQWLTRISYYFTRS